VTKANRWQTIYLAVFFVILYLPVLSVILYSFNANPSTAKWTGLTLDWYRELFDDLKKHQPARYSSSAFKWQSSLPRFPLC
jgi:ABC-type spermidine/putrescine transport system permease subunit II